MRCRICDTIAEHAFSTPIMGQYDGRFCYCSNCGFLQSQDPFWLKEAYSSAIVDADTGLVRRNLELARRTSALLYFVYPKSAKFLDIAGGYGLFVRLMRDTGFDFYWSDKYCKNILAVGFESDTASSYASVTAFEVLEHITHPLEFIRDALATAGCDTLFFSTELFEGTPPKPGEWWYYAFEEGQHISFYQRRTLEAIADRLGMRLSSRGSIHMLSKSLSPPLFSLLTRPLVAAVLSVFPKTRLTSRTMPDHLHLIRKDTSKGKNSVIDTPNR